MLLLGLSSPPSFFLNLPPQTNLQTLNLAPSTLSRKLLRNQLFIYPGNLTFSPLRSSLRGESPTSPPLLITDIIERDWSFLEVDTVNSEEERRRKADHIISAVGVGKGSRVLVCMGSEWFVDRLAASAPSCELLLIIHESILVLAMIKEKYDKIRCWQGEITALPERFSRFDAVFVCYFPGMGISLDQLLSSAGSCCSPGARLLISYDQGKEVIEGRHRELYPDMVTSQLPERSALERAAANHSFQKILRADDGMDHTPQYVCGNTGAIYTTTARLD